MAQYGPPNIFADSPLTVADPTDNVATQRQREAEVAMIHRFDGVEVFPSAVYADRARIPDMTMETLRAEQAATLDSTLSVGGLATLLAGIDITGAAVVSGNISSTSGNVLGTHGTSSATIYRRDDGSNTQVTAYYITLTSTVRLWSGVLAVAPANYSTTSGGSAGNVGSNGDLFLATIGTYHKVSGSWASLV